MVFIVILSQFAVNKIYFDFGTIFGALKFTPECTNLRQR